MDPHHSPIRLRYDLPDRAGDYGFVDAMSLAVGVLLGTLSGFAAGFVVSDALASSLPAVDQRLMMGGLILVWMASSFALSRIAVLRIRRGQRTRSGDDTNWWTFWRRPSYRLGFLIGVGVGCVLLTVLWIIGFALPT
jgi:hypothetical protein